MELTSKTRKELANDYRVSPPTLDKMLAPLSFLFKKDDKPKRLYFPNEVQIIWEKYGKPE